MLEGHGDDLYRYAGRVKTNFSSNIYTGMNLTPLKKHLAMRLDVVTNYPEPEPLTLEATIAERKGVRPSEVMATPGATGAIYLVARSFAFDDDNQPFLHVVSQPTFSEYADACRAVGITPSNGAGELAGYRVRWLCVPNNPTGGTITASTLLDMARKRPREIFVIDQSYCNYCMERPLSLREAVQAGNIIAIRSFSKDYGVPGLRLGYACGSEALIERMRRHRQPWSVGALDAEAALFLLKHGDGVWNHTRQLVDEAQRLRRELCGVDSITVLDTLTNFMLCRMEYGTAAELKQWLVSEHGFLVRDASNFIGLDSRFFRVAAQSTAADNALVNAISQYMHDIRSNSI